jgi:hypothetical protein
MDTLRSWVAAALPTLTAVIERTRGQGDPPRPELPYAALEISADLPRSATPYDHTTTTPDGDLFVRNRWQRRIGVLVVDIHGPEAQALGRQLQISYPQATEWNILRDGGVTVHPLGDVTNLAALRDTAHEEQARMEFQILFVTSNEESVPVIETVDVPFTLT